MQSKTLERSINTAQTNLPLSNTAFQSSTNVNKTRFAPHVFLYADINFDKNSSEKGVKDSWTNIS